MCKCMCIGICDVSDVRQMKQFSDALVMHNDLAVDGCQYWHVTNRLLLITPIAGQPRATVHGLNYHTNFYGIPYH